MTLRRFWRSARPARSIIEVPLRGQSNNSLYRSVNRGKDWESTSPVHIRDRRVTMDISSLHIPFGQVGGGIHNCKSQDSGRAVVHAVWYARTDHLRSRRGVPGITDVGVMFPSRDTQGTNITLSSADQ
jgi:hypothetical protein